jgi:hypothetical protein
MAQLTTLRPANRREIWTLVVGVLAAIIIAIVGVLADVPKTLGGLVGDPLTGSIVVTVTIPITIMLVANQASQLLKTSTQKEELLTEFIRALPHLTSMIQLDSSTHGMNYLTNAVGRARKCYNMRLTTRSVEAKDPLNLKLTAAFDRAVERALRNGMDYFFIVSTDHSSGVNALKSKRSRMAASSSSIGSYIGYVRPRSESPLFHFCVLDFGSEKELVLGWALEGSEYFSEKVFIIRDVRLADYFHVLFEHYSRRALIV